MNTIPVDPMSPREGTVLPRFLALILFALAALSLPLILASTLALFGGDWRGAGLMVVVVPLAWLPAWVGKLLWTGRSIPIWFIRASCVGAVALPVLTFLLCGEWFKSLSLLGMIILTLSLIRSARRLAPKKPVGPRDFDDFS